MAPDCTLAEQRAEESRRFLERNSDAIRRAFWQMKGEQALAQHRAEEERRA